jgi:hypothetical protein
VLERVDGVVGHRALVERGQVPDVEVRGPERQGDDRVPEHAHERDGAQQRREHRTGQPEDDQQRAEVGDQQVLEHVRPEQLLAHHRERRRQSHRHQREPAVEAPLAPRGRGDRAVAQGVHDGDDHHRQQLQGCELDAHRGRYRCTHVQP